MRKILSLIAILCMAIGFTSCSETDIENEEFSNWQERNTTYFNNVYNTAVSAIDNKSTKWKIIRAYTKLASTAKEPTENIVVEVLDKGTGTTSPLFTDSVAVHYKGYLIPSASFPNGYNFDSSWTGNYNPDTMTPTKFSIQSNIIGFASALINMHEGDRWRIYIPYELGYGTIANSNIPAYSTLVFDVTLKKYW